jgi:molybdopterin-guanine dinucleotide biosynthesis protein A
MSGGENSIAVLLAGGRSSRMGRDKASLRIPGDGRTLAELALERLARACGRGVVAGPAERDWGTEWPSVPDGPGAGPVAGLLGAARAHPGRRLLALGCDLPEVSSELLAALAASPAQLALPKTEKGPEPLCALYGPAALEILEKRVADGRFALRGLFDEDLPFEVDVFEGERLRQYGDPRRLFLNLNHPADLEDWLARRERASRGSARNQ